MKLYGALVQTEISRVQNAHGLKECWAWLARFLNALSANRYNAVALKAFLYVHCLVPGESVEELFCRYSCCVRQALCILGSYVKCKETWNFDERKRNLPCRNIRRILNRTPIRDLNVWPTIQVILYTDAY
ncbi:hypothetical protein ACFX13_036089 [Malus domestica]